MSDWRDDLPPIPADRIRNDTIREGTRRHERRRRRQRTILLGGMGAAAVALIVAAGVLTQPADDDDGDAASTAPAATDSPADTAAATTGRGAPSGTDAPAATEAEATEATAAATTAGEAPGATAAEATAGTAPVDYTTIGGPGAELPVNTEILVVPAVIWEEPPGGPACGPTTVEVVIPQSLGLTNPVVRWQTADLNGEVPTIVDDNGAHATIGPFGPETLGVDVRHELLVVVVGTDQSGAEQVVRAPSAVLIDCS